MILFDTILIYLIIIFQKNKTVFNILIFYFNSYWKSISFHFFSFKVDIKSAAVTFFQLQFSSVWLCFLWSCVIPSKAYKLFKISGTFLLSVFISLVGMSDFMKLFADAKFEMFIAEPGWMIIELPTDFFKTSCVLNALLSIFLFLDMLLINLLFNFDWNYSFISNLGTSAELSLSFLIETIFLTV